MPSRNHTFFLAIILAVAFSFFRGVFDHHPITSAQDEKEYRYLELDNQLKVLLISDENADHAAASLDVNVGSLQDPAHRAGLAHFLEHMLFLGTKTYPEAGDYQAFISQHGGSHNAFTAAEHTNYYFQIDGEQLYGALDRFSKFFHEPLFTEKYVQREKEAVNSEYKSKYKDDFRRMQYVMKTLVNKEHPLSQFATGNIDTLSDNDKTNVRDDLLAFYERYYSSNLMTLTIYGPQNLDTLYQWSKKLFNPIQNKDTKLQPYPSIIYPEKAVDVSIKPVKDIYRLSYMFELNSPLDNYKQKPSHYVGHLLGHEGEGSLLAWLKSKNWADGLSAGTYHRLANNSAFNVSISLTNTGLNHIDEITEQLFAYVRLIEKQGIEKWVFDELKDLGKMHFEFRPGQQPSSLVQGLSMSMHDYPSKHILNGPYLWKDFNQASIKKVLAKLTPNNMIRTLVSPYVETNQIETWFAAPYAISNIDDAKLETWNQANLAEGLYIPKANPFIPQDLTVLDSSEETVPQSILETEELKAWHLLDTEFKGPQSSVYVSLRSPLSQNSPEDYVLIDAWVQLLNDHLNSFSYPALLAGQGYSLYHHMRGIGIRLHGYRDKQDVLLEEILTTFKTFEPTKEQWQSIQQELQRRYQNSLKQKPYERSIAQMMQTLTKPSFSEESLLTAIQNSDKQQLVALKNKFLKQMEVIVLGHGNISQKQLQKSTELIKSNLLTDNTPISVAKKTLIQLDKGITKKTVTAQHSDNSMTVYYQAQTDDLKERATIGLLAQTLKAPYYTLMRTQRKHGYIVFATAYPILEQGGFAFIVQSPTTSSDQLFQESQIFLEDFTISLEKMSDEDFSAHQQSLVNNLLKKPLNLGERTGEYWRELDRENFDFDTKHKLADLIKSLDKEDLISYLNDVLLSPNVKALFLHFDGSPITKIERI